MNPKLNFMHLKDSLDVTGFAKRDIQDQLPEGGEAIAALLQKVTLSMEEDLKYDQYHLRTHWHWCIDGENFTTARNLVMDRHILDITNTYSSTDAILTVIERATKLSTDELLNFAAYI